MSDTNFLTLLATFNTKPEYTEQFKAALIDDLHNAKKEPGNVTMELYQHNEKKNVLYFFERWKSKEALDEHFKKPYTKGVFELAEKALASPLIIDYLDDFSPLAKEEMKKPLAADNPVDLVVLFEVKPDKKDVFVKQFEKSVVKSRPEPGNILFHIHKVKDKENHYVLYERWRSQAALDSHFAEPYTVELFDMFKTALVRPVEEYLNFITEIGYEERK